MFSLGVLSKFARNINSSCGVFQPYCEEESVGKKRVGGASKLFLKV